MAYALAMTNPANPRIPGRKAPRLVALAVVALLLASCTTSTSSSSDTTTASDATTTTEVSGGSDTTTPDTDTDTDDDNDTDLEAYLPDAADVGPDYFVDDSDDDSDDESPVSAALDDACPAVSEFGSDDDDDDDAVERAFATADGRTFKVELTPDISEGDMSEEADLEKYVDAVNDCGAAEFTSGGIDFTMHLTARMDPGFGDFGAVVLLDATGEHPQLAEPIQIEGIMRAFAVDQIGVTLSAFSGLDDDTYEMIPADLEATEIVGDQIERAIREG